MDTRQLRVGNLVTTNGKPMDTYRGGIYRVARTIIHNIANPAVIETTSNNFYDETTVIGDNLEPIEVTPDLLRGLGFKSTGWARFNTELSVYNIEIFDIKENNHVLSISLENKNILSCYFKYLHQLQNIIFDMTDLELNVDNLITK